MPRTSASKNRRGHSRTGRGLLARIRRVDWGRWAPWLAIGVYVVSPIDFDPGLPFTDAAAIAFGVWHESKRRKNPRARA